MNLAKRARSVHALEHHAVVKAMFDAHNLGFCKSASELMVLAQLACGKEAMLAMHDAYAWLKTTAHRDVLLWRLHLACEALRATRTPFHLCEGGLLTHCVRVLELTVQTHAPLARAALRVLAEIARSAQQGAQAVLAAGVARRVAKYMRLFSVHDIGYFVFCILGFKTLHAKATSSTAISALVAYSLRARFEFFGPLDVLPRSWRLAFCTQLRTAARACERYEVGIDGGRVHDITDDASIGEQVTFLELYGCVKPQQRYGRARRIARMHNMIVHDRMLPRAGAGGWPVLTDAQCAQLWDANQARLRRFSLLGGDPDFKLVRQWVLFRFTQSVVLTVRNRYDRAVLARHINRVLANLEKARLAPGPRTPFWLRW